ncbi:MAG: DUF4142 domain-containing protein [Bryobacteraceae bacterium]
MERTFQHRALLVATSLFLSGGLLAFAQQQPGGAGQPQQQPMPRQQQQPGMGHPGSPGYNPGAVNNPPARQKVNDKKFVKKAAEGGMTEIAMGKLAAQKGTTPAIKQFGEKLVNDHTKADNQLKQVATEANANLPSSLSSKHQKEVNKLAKLSGKKFDKAFVKRAVKDHKNDIEEFKAEAQGGSNSAVRQFASNNLPVLQEHLNIAESLKKSKGQSGMGNQNGMSGQNGGMRGQGTQ